MSELSELELLGFFEVEPERDEFLLKYAVGDCSGVNLLFLYNPVEKYIQTTLRYGSDEVMAVSCDTISRAWIDGRVLHAEFTYTGGVVRLELAVRPKLRINWVGLRIA